MFISSNSINEIKSVGVYDVVRHYVQLKKKGSAYQGLCPFHVEKSPSFSVNTAKDIYKCFGCGESGDAISFVMKHEKLNFYEACEEIAKIAQINIQYDDPENKEELIAKKSEADKQELALNITVPLYHKNLMELADDHPVWVFLLERNINREVAEQWRIGWSGIEWSFLTPLLTKQDLYYAGEKLGLIKKAKVDDRSYDGYRSRITIPIADRHGRLIGLGGRFIEVDPADKGKNYAKYINPSECEIYDKSAVLYGLHNAADAIKEKGFSFLVEGYLDVIVPHLNGIKNVVATCGTALTDRQIKLLKRYSTHVAIWRDNDTAGVTSAIKAIPELLKHDFKVEYVKYEGKDPDEWVRAQKVEENEEIKAPVKTDAITWYSAELFSKAAEDIHELAKAKRTTLEMLACIKNDMVRNAYLDRLIALHKWKAVDTKKELSGLLEASDESDDDFFGDGIKFPEWLTSEQKDLAIQKGYVPVHRKVNGKPMVGYYGFTSSGKQEITNFLAYPLFHIYAGENSRYMLRIDNGYRESVLDLPAKIMPSNDQFQSFTVNEGNFMIFGSKQQWQRIASDLLQQFPRCTEIRTLGWQKFGFFAYVDKIYLPGKGTADLDRWGIFKYDNDNFLIPASCEAYLQLEKSGDDPFENDRYLIFKKTTLTFKSWANLMEKVYKEKGPISVAYAVLTIFRDIIFDVDNNCPHLYAFGEPSSGKSKWAESITAIFYYKRAAFNLNSGTDFAFFNYMSKYANCPAHLNEFEIEVIKPDWFQAIKGAYDGEGRERGKGGSKNKTEIQKVKSTLILTGQKLITADDNSVVTRSIIEPFSTREKGFTNEEKKAYDTLKDYEGEGLSGMLPELLQYRPYFKESYKEEYNNMLGTWRKKIDQSKFNQRILQNYAHLAACYKIIAEKLQLSTTAEEFIKYCLQKAEKWSMFIRNSDTLSEFWNTLSYLVDQQQLVDGWNYIIEDSLSITVRTSRSETATINFEKPTKILYLRINEVHKLFQMEFRKRTGKEAMNLDTLMHYFSGRSYYIGSVKSKKFKRYELVTVEKSNGAPPGGIPTTIPVTEKKMQVLNSSCYAFIYDQLGIEIAKDEPGDEHGNPDSGGVEEWRPADGLPFE
jgi:DNA primase